ncbi:MAG: cupredoxin domain-containing protein [Nitrososphaera sp.]|jgi:plastocyanin
MNKTAAMVVMAAILVSGLVVVSALGSSAKAYAQSGKEAKIDIVKNATNMKDKAFSPNPLKVQPGTKVTWTNADSALHTVTSGKGATPDKMFDSKSLAPKKEFSFKFDKKGTFNYFCMLHPTMVGKVVVE